jgi:hypothetical protein
MLRGEMRRDEGRQTSSSAKFENSLGLDKLRIRFKVQGDRATCIPEKMTLYLPSTNFSIDLMTATHFQMSYVIWLSSGHMCSDMLLVQKLANGHTSKTLRRRAGYGNPGDQALRGSSSRVMSM